MSRLKRRGGTHNAPDHDYIPAHIGEGFQRSLLSLVDNLASEGAFKEKYLQSELLSKYVDKTTTSPADRRQAAITKWLFVEENNRKTNERILLGDADFGWTTSDRLIRKAREVIRDTLGDSPPEDILSSGHHTFGASTRVRRGPQAAFFKHVGEAHCTSAASGLFALAFSGSRMSKQDIVLQESSVMFTVPKSSDIDRVACKEPEINMMLQRQVGSFISKRLRKRCNISLTDQGVNQRLARDALHLGLATVDLSSASDSITRQLVVSLLPIDWWFLLDRIRVHSTLIDGSTHELEMFSSMGNGFTFELESLLFYALTRAVCWASRTQGRVSVYGDDIILPKTVAARFARALAWFGFKVNTKKSHWTGWFRESCGKHYHRNSDVTPFYIREPVRKKSDIIRLLNRLLLWDGSFGEFLVTPQVIEFHMKWKTVIPDHLHGGVDPERIDALVTGDHPRQRLLWRGRALDRFDQGALEYWYALTSERKGFFPSVHLNTAATSIRSGAHIELDPRRIGKAIMARQPSWLWPTTWTPYLLAETWTHDVGLSP